MRRSFVACASPFTMARHQSFSASPRYWVISTWASRTSNSPECAINSSDSGKTTSVSSTIHASSGLAGFKKLGKRSWREATSSYGIGGNSSPVGSAASASMPHSPPDSEIAPSRTPVGHLGCPKISSASMKVDVSVTSIPPWW